MSVTAHDDGGRRALREQRERDVVVSPLPDLTKVFAGRYRALAPLGPRGHDAHAFRARDDILLRDVVVKVFPVDPVGASDPPRRLEGARALTTLDHPFLVTLYDAHLTADGRGYLVTELIDGPSLRERLDDGGPLRPDAAAALVEDLSRALAAVHEVGIVHHHLTSGHILLRPIHHPGRRFIAVLADFGVTHLLAGASAGAAPDDDDYLTPEQIRGEVPGAAADIYALGLLAVEALTGESPVLGGAAQHLVLAPLDFDPVIPSRFGRGWEVLLTAMTDPDPVRRPTAAEVVGLVAELRGGTATSGPVTSLAPVLAPLPSPLEIEPVSALRAVGQARETAARHRRSPIWAWVTHAR